MIYEVRELCPIENVWRPVGSGATANEAMILLCILRKSDPSTKVSIKRIKV